MGKNRVFDSVNCKVKILAKRVNRLNLRDIALLRSEKSSFLVFHTNASKFSRERRLHFTDKYMKNKTLDLWLSF